MTHTASSEVRPGDDAALLSWLTENPFQKRTYLEGRSLPGHYGWMNNRFATTFGMLAKTAPLVGGLGMGLYGILGVVTALEGAQWLISLLIALPIAGLLGFAAVEALQSGCFPAKPGAIYRRRQPLTYWFLTTLYLVCSLLLGMLSARSLYCLVVAA